MDKELIKMLGKNYTPKEYEKALHKLQAKRKAENEEVESKNLYSELENVKS